MTSTLLSVSGFLAAVLLHSVAARWFPLGNRVKLFAFVAVAGAVALGFSMKEKDVGVVLSAFLVYALLCELYVFAFTLALGSISANMLMLLRHGEASLAELRNRYAATSMTSLRIQRLCHAGYLRQADEGWTLT